MIIGLHPKTTDFFFHFFFPKQLTFFPKTAHFFQILERPRKNKQTKKLLYTPPPYKRSGDKLVRRPIFEPNWSGDSTFLAISLKRGFTVFKAKLDGRRFLSPDLLYGGCIIFIYARYM